MVLVGALYACGDDSPMEVEFQVIDEVEFDASLNIDLSAMERLPSGVYIQDLVEGTGDPLVLGMTATVRYTGWITSGLQFDAGELPPFIVGNRQYLPAFEDGVVGMQMGGTRLIIIPPSLGYGAAAVGSIPSGSILIFQLELLAIS